MQRAGIDHDEIRPWQWATMPLKGSPVEIVSYPIPNDDEPDTIMVRLTVGDPTSIKEVPLKMVACFAPDRHEDFYRPKQYYSDNPTAFVFTD